MVRRDYRRVDAGMAALVRSGEHNIIAAKIEVARKIAEGTATAGNKRGLIGDEQRQSNLRGGQDGGVNAFLSVSARADENAVVATDDDDAGFGAEGKEVARAAGDRCVQVSDSIRQAGGESRREIQALLAGNARSLESEMIAAEAGGVRQAREIAHAPGNGSGQVGDEILARDRRISRRPNDHREGVGVGRGPRGTGILRVTATQDRGFARGRYARGPLQNFSTLGAQHDPVTAVRLKKKGGDGLPGHPARIAARGEGELDRVGRAGKIHEHSGVRERLAWVWRIRINPKPDDRWIVGVPRIQGNGDGVERVRCGPETEFGGKPGCRVYELL